MKKVLFIIILSWFSGVTSQKSISFKKDDINELPQEEIHLHFNNRLLLSGETLYYKIYCMDDTHSLSKYSKIAYVELISSENKTVIKQKVKLKSGSGYGDFFVNTDIKTGWYTLISYTQWMKNFNNYFEETVFIVNPSSEVKKKQVASIKKDNFPIKSISDSNFSDIIITDKKVYKRKEKVDVNLERLKLRYPNSNLSISVKRKENIQLPLRKKIDKRKNIKKNIEGIFYLPELRGTILHGKIMGKNSAVISNIKLSLSTNHKSLPLLATTNTSGEFYFNLDNLKKDKVYIQILNSDSKNYTITLLENDTHKKEFTNFLDFDIADDIYKLRYRNIYSQIENAYYEVKQDIQLLKNQEETLFVNKQKDYLLDDYKRFETLKETFVEIIDKAKIRNLKEGYRFVVPLSDIDEISSVESLPSLLIVDGYVVHNHNDFIDYDSRKIKKVSIITEKYFYGNAIYQGVLLIETFKKDYMLNNNQIKEFEVLKVQPEKEYFFQRYDNDSLSLDRIPDFRTQLYWNPNLILSDENTISFYTSDVSGVFEIEITGITQEGKPISARKKFKVE